MNSLFSTLLVLNCYSVLIVQGEKIAVVGLPFGKGQGKKGVEHGPQALRRHGLLSELTFDDIEERTVYDVGNVRCDLKNSSIYTNFKSFQGANNAPEVLCYVDEVYKTISDILKEDSVRLLTLGGDHSVSVGTILGHLSAANNKVSLIWFDAHGDINTPCTSTSGNIHGMPVSMLLRELSDHWAMPVERPYILSTQNIAYIGLRDLDTAERIILNNLGIVHYGMDDIDQLGIDTVLNDVLAFIDPHDDRSLHVSFDIDVLDPLEAPSTGTVVRGGLTLREAIVMLEKLHDTGRLKVFELLELNPHIGDAKDVNTTLDAGIRLLKASSGYKRTRNYRWDEYKLPTCRKSVEATEIVEDNY